ncbi:MAG TPA: ribosome biogenesis GTP-binding protein YihA/YsxC [Candidatus Accumulibacter phosphatis]|nr:MAG: putative GTP-binding protein EngB [Candidatus Accumulibacter sp. SK-11]HAY28127.1 YihA family ribosome biogenesis GTP-binding protein [Accumulibacter sp.]HRL74325.1 ribosome biogenesis GTP-binding protein YihA/YsxC [Candidatus Accumulibacter phosphatis]HCN67485.1 YihA family ribosome biogenesis GTP-binding protein [Accumulibacter sp.]HCV14429.1 YihA family ribosome biogenesis GTP-binding protein [Accumulibacter sp.]
MPLFQKAVFQTTVARLQDLPADSQAEIAFAGRSNSGKSSAINALANHTRLAFVSRTPGRTQHINYFRIEAGKYLVDLPGYGFAKAPEEIRSQWEGLLAPYLRYREALCGLVLIMDSRHPLTELDLQMLGWFAPTGKPIHVLLSKADKLTRQQQDLAAREVAQVLATTGGRCTWQLFSSLRKWGIVQAEAVLAGWLGLRVKEAAAAPANSPGARTAHRKRAAIGWSARSAAGSKPQKKPPAKGGSRGQDMP